MCQAGSRLPRVHASSAILGNTGDGTSRPSGSLGGKEAISLLDLRCHRSRWISENLTQVLNFIRGLNRLDVGLADDVPRNNASGDGSTRVAITQSWLDQPCSFGAGIMVVDFVWH